MTSKLVTQYGDTINCATALKVLLDFFRRSTIVHVAHIDTATVHFHFLFICGMRSHWSASLNILLSCLVHFTKLSSFCFHFSHALFHRLQVSIFRVGLSSFSRILMLSRILSKVCLTLCLFSTDGPDCFACLHVCRQAIPSRRERDLLPMMSREYRSTSFCCLR